MSMQKLCNEKYKNLCSQLGQVAAQKQIVDTQHAELIMQIKMLNEHVPDLIKFEQQVLAEVALRAREKQAEMEACEKQTATKQDIDKA